MFIQRTLNTIFLCLVVFGCHAWGQADSLYISDIEITGNKHTRDFVILKELGVTAGDRIHELQLKPMEDRILNTGLFSFANASLKRTDGGPAILQIDVREGWYFFPSPSVDFADDDFNSWLDEGGMSINRLNFGLKIYHLNLTGRADYFKAYAEFGFRRKFGMEYRLPYFNEARTLGVGLDFSYTENKEVAYTTIRDELQFLSTGSNNLLSSFTAGIKGTFRPGLHNIHSLGLRFNRFGVADSVTRLNPHFFDKNSTGLKFFSAEYTFDADHRNRRQIPHSGYKFTAKIKKEGLGIFNEVNLGTIEFEFEKYFPISHRFTAYVHPKARIYFIRNAPPYYLNAALGNGGRHIRGYDEYAINGMDYIHAIAGVRCLIMDSNINFGRMMPAKKLRHMPLKIYLAANADAGRVWDPNFGQLNKLDNKLLVGYGPAVHFLMYETFHFTVEYNFNHLYESGLYLQSEFNL